MPEIASWHEIAKRWPWLLVLVVVLMGATAIEASAASRQQAHVSRFVAMKEWKREAKHEARRECLRIQREFKQRHGFDLRECIGDSDTSGPCLRSLQGDQAFCRAEFEIEYKEIGKTRVYVGYVHMHVGQNDKIAVERPVGWRSHWLGGEPT